MQIVIQFLRIKKHGLKMITNYNKSMNAIDYEGLPFFEIKFQDKNTVVGISYIHANRKINKVKNHEIIDKAYALYLKKWKDLYLEKQLKITKIMLWPGYTPSGSNKMTDVRERKYVPGYLGIRYEDLIIKKSEPVDIDFKIFQPRNHSRNFKLGDCYNNTDLAVDGISFSGLTSISNILMSYDGYFEGHTFNEVERLIEEILNNLNLVRERVRNRKNEYILKASNKIMDKYNLSKKDAIDFITRSDNEEWIFEYKTIKYDEMTIREYDEIVERTGYNFDCNEDSYGNNVYFDGNNTQCIRNRKIKQLVDISKKNFT